MCICLSFALDSRDAASSPPGIVPLATAAVISADQPTYAIFSEVGRGLSDLDRGQQELLISEYSHLFLDSEDGAGLLVCFADLVCGLRLPPSVTLVGPSEHLAGFRTVARAAIEFPSVVGSLQYQWRGKTRRWRGDGDCEACSPAVFRTVGRSTARVVLRQHGTDSDFPSHFQHIAGGYGCFRDRVQLF